MTYGQLGILDSIAFGIGLILEIPTGAIADLIGKKTTLQISSLLITCGIFTQALGQDIWTLFWGNIIFFIGMSFYSGAADALLYDTLNEKKQIADYEKTLAASRSFGQIGFIIAVIAGGLLSTINIRIPWLVWGAFHFIGFISTFWLYEPKTKKINFSFKNYFQQNMEGFRQLFLPKLKPFVIFIFLILGVNYIYEWGFLKPTISLSYNFDSVGMALLFAGGSLLSAVLLKYLPSLRHKLKDYQGMVFLNTLSILTIFLFGLNIGHWGAIPIILIAIVGNFSITWVTIIINQHVASEYRATTLSTVAMFLKIPFVFTSFLMGNLIEEGFLRPVMLSLALFLCIISIIEIYITKKYTTKNS